MRVLLLGANGRMGQKMQQYLKDNNVDFCGVDVENKQCANNYDADVIIDFSTANALYDNLELAKHRHLPIVIATTGHNDKAYGLIQHHSQSVPILLAPNLSVQFNVFCQLLKDLRGLKDNQFVLQEIHHKYKKDSPSGSAKQLVQLLSTIDVLPSVYSIRAGDVVGQHTLIVYGEAETLTISHTSTDRLVYCKGAMQAANFILGKSCGLYTMKDMLQNDCK